MTTSGELRPLLWRVSPAIATVLFLMAAALFAVAIYLHPGFTLTTVVGALGIASALAGSHVARQLLYADDDGIVVRRLFSTRSLSWTKIEAINVVRRGKTGMTVSIDLIEGPSVLVPPSLVLPAKPHNLLATQVLLRAKARQLAAVGGIEKD